MSNPLIPVLPCVVAAARSLALGVRWPTNSESQSIISAEAEYEFLKALAFFLLSSWVMLNLMIQFPGLGAVISEYNQF
jgi:hypothetical protein